MSSFSGACGGPHPGLRVVQKRPQCELIRLERAAHGTLERRTLQAAIAVATDEPRFFSTVPMPRVPVIVLSAGQLSFGGADRDGLAAWTEPVPSLPCDAHMQRSRAL